MLLCASAIDPPSRIEDAVETERYPRQAHFKPRSIEFVRECPEPRYSECLKRLVRR